MWIMLLFFQTQFNIQRLLEVLRLNFVKPLWQEVPFLLNLIKHPRCFFSRSAKVTESTLGCVEYDDAL